MYISSSGSKPENISNPWTLSLNPNIHRYFPKPPRRKEFVYLGTPLSVLNPVTAPLHKLLKTVFNSAPKITHCVFLGIK